MNETALTTHDLHLDVEGLHAGADPDDNITNLRVSKILTSALEIDTFKSIIQNAEKNGFTC